jgi:cbb3-type cytochrome oxidase cytochrome c subunit
MRERLSRWIACLTAGVTVLLAVAFAWIQNPPPAAVEAPSAVPAAALPSGRTAIVEAGRAAYEEQGCGMCHSIAGVGNPRYPLDGVGARMKPEEIRKWIAGARDLEGRLPAGTFRIKQGYQALPKEEMDALVAYMQSLRR